MLIYAISGIVLYMLICWRSAYVYVRPPRSKVTLPSWAREVSVPSPHGAIPAWASPGLAEEKGKRVVFVLAHGYGGDRSTWSEAIQDLAKRGYESVAPCMPGQDASPESNVGFGPREAQTIVDTVKWVRAQYQKPPFVILWGVSMGGSAVWLASALDPTVDAVVSEGAYARFDEAMNGWLNHVLPGGSILLKPMVWIACRMDHLDPSSILPVEAASKWTKPALVVQGGKDQLIPLSHAVRLAEAAHCPLWVVPNAEHVECYDLAKVEYLRRLDGLVAEVVNRTR